MGLVNIAGYGLGIGAVGQGLFYIALFPDLPFWLAFVLLLAPWLIVHTISFCRQPPCGPRSFRNSLMTAMISYAMVTGAAELLHVFLHPIRGHFYYTVARLFMYSPVLSFGVLIWFCVRLRHFEKEDPVEGRVE